MRVLSGIQSSGKSHLGNYFGMMRPVLAMQETAEVYLFIADYHALTTLEDPTSLRQDTLDVALDFLACGLDPDRVVFYRQSDVPEIMELTWLLSIVTPVGLLERCHSYKDKVARGIPASHALFAYPVLMAADILAVQSDLVPVGKDQKQHLEVARDIAIKFNHRFGDVFRIPEPQISDDVAVIPGIDGQKMSKTYGNAIEIFDAPKATRKKIMRIVTDSKGLEDPKDPDASTIYALFKLFADEAERTDLANRYRAGGMGYGEAKQALFEKFEEHFQPLRERRETFVNDPDRVKDVLADGAAKASTVIRETLRRARRAIGLD